MERICEPELMEDVAQAQAYGAADFSASDQALVERLAQLLGPAGLEQTQGIIDLGCGPGNISFRLVERFPQAQVVGLDGAAAMLDLAEQTLRRQPQWRRRLAFRPALLPLTPALAKDLVAAAGAEFGVVVSNSLLHHLHEPQVLWRTVRQLASPGALVLIRDLRRPASPEALRQLVQRHASSAPELLQRDYGHSLAAAFTLAEVQAQLRQAALPQLEVRELGDRYLEVAGRLA
jgi:trans-aconitate methyltransferase